jgi:hypothetical protein
MEASVSGLIEVAYYRSICSDSVRNLTKNHSKEIDIITEHLPNTSLDRYRSDNQFGYAVQYAKIWITSR